MNLLRFCVLALLGVSGPAAAAEAGFPVRPYVDPEQLRVPAGQHSFYKQPWRAWLETRSGFDFLQGIGINYNAHRGVEPAVRLLAESGFRTFRIEVGWGGVSWDEQSLSNAKHLGELLRLCRAHGIRPTMLLNAHHGVPCPLRNFTRRAAADAPKGSRTLHLDHVADLEATRTGLSEVTGYQAAEILITSVDAKTGVCGLSRPLPKDIKAGGEVRLSTLKFRPLYPVGTPEFEETAQGWVRYAMLVCRAVKEAGIEDFDVELWNELSFGSNFTGINHYYDPPLIPSPKDFLREGGPCWEMANRTIAAVRKEHPRARVIWGFSNTTFWHTPVARLPPGTDGQSYHPYGTGTKKFPEGEDQKDRNFERFTPAMDMRVSEGWAQLFTKVETLTHMLEPNARLEQRPPQTGRFHHYFTEHGVAPKGDCGVTDEALAWSLKTKCALRSFCFWLNKGLDVLHYFCAAEKEATGMGLLPPELEKLPASAAFDEVATPPMRALRNLTRAFTNCVPLQATQPLQADVVALGEQRRIFEGNAAHPPLWQREAFALLPFQVNRNRIIVAVYDMTFDAMKPGVESRYRITLGGLRGLASVGLYDPVLDRTIPVQSRAAAGGQEIELTVTDYPRLLVLDQRPDGG